MTDTILPLEVCPGCRVAPDNPHDEHCDHARCPDCGEQLIFHSCEKWQLADADGPDRPAMWHGVAPGAEVARIRGWWTTAVGIDYLVEDDTRVTIAVALKMVTWDPAGQRYIIGEIDEARLDQVMRDNGLTR